MVLGLVAISALACDSSDRTETRSLPDAGIPSGPSAELDASAPERDLDAAAGATDAADSSAQPPPQTICQALSNTGCSSSFIPCEDPASTLAAASGRCGRPPFVRSVAQGSACDRTFVAYRYGADDTTIFFFDMVSGELTGSWNESDTGVIDCSGEVDLACAEGIELSLPGQGGCVPDAGAGGADDAGATGS